MCVFVCFEYLEGYTSFLYHAVHHFWPHLSKVKNHFKNPEYPDTDLHQNLINSFLSATKSVHQVSSESVHNHLRYLAHRQTDRQTDRQ